VKNLPLFLFLVFFIDFFLFFLNGLIIPSDLPDEE